MIPIDKKNAEFVYYSLRERVAIEILAKKIGSRNLSVTAARGFDNYDGKWINSGHTPEAIEVKIRDRYTTDFPLWYFERVKYDALMILHTGITIQYNPLYIMFLKDCIVMWNISAVTRNQFKLEDLRETSVDGNKDTKMKWATQLSINDATAVIPYKKESENDAWGYFPKSYINAEARKRFNSLYKINENPTSI